MVRESTLHITLDRDTLTIHFHDDATNTVFFADGTDIPTQNPDDPHEDNETKLDLAQHYLLHLLDANGYDCRALSRLLGANNIKVLLPMVMGLYLDEAQDDVEKGLRGMHTMLARMISLMVERETAREKLRAEKRKGEAEAARREEDAGEGRDEMF